MILLVSLDSYSRYFSNDIGDVIIEVLVCLRDFFLSFFPCFSRSPLSFFFIVNYVILFLELERVAHNICNL